MWTWFDFVEGKKQSIPRQVTTSFSGLFPQPCFYSLRRNEVEAMEGEADSKQILKRSPLTEHSFQYDSGDKVRVVALTVDLDRNNGWL